MRYLVVLVLLLLCLFGCMPGPGMIGGGAIEENPRGMTCVTRGAVTHCDPD